MATSRIVAAQKGGPARPVACHHSRARPHRVLRLRRHHAPRRPPFRSARDYAAWLGLTPRAHSSGGKERLGRISRAGSRSLRRLLYPGAMARILGWGGGRQVVPGEQAPGWRNLRARNPVKVVAVALAARMARTVRALIARGGSYRSCAGP